MVVDLSGSTLLQEEQLQRVGSAPLQYLKIDTWACDGCKTDCSEAVRRAVTVDH